MTLKEQRIVVAAVYALGKVLDDAGIDWVDCPEYMALRGMVEHE